MIKITNNGSGSISLPVAGGVTLEAEGGFAVVEQGEWENLLALSTVARSLSIRGIITASEYVPEPVEIDQPVDAPAKASRAK